ncbi:MAG: glutamine--fructose-6-phosphate transaminase (isomerizing) [Spirochaetaceae bacterium]|jgi:glucosamine--fructose-6-phosphate aminotransferase (isomerizing)|nr:glutamine--fructose-6-phosphate transaminase (isomerizing) [Spirochaetaceae bacterium]
MCGITGYIGREEAIFVLLDSLKKLEYRGYDSTGIAILHEGTLTVRKAKGHITVLEEKLKNEQIRGQAGIGHTRWATHGEPSDINAHPHTGVSDRIAVVHNGIIENYLRLKEWLQAREVVFKSETDTEVVAHLIDYYYRQGSGLLTAVQHTLKRLEGSYALAITAADYPDRIIAARKDSPLVIGLGKDENLVASDIPALLAHTREVVYMEDGELVVLYRDHVELMNAQGDHIVRPPSHVDWDADAAEKGGFAHFMLKEIHDQAKALSDTLRPRIKTGEISFDEFDFDEFCGRARRIVITACGTAWHAAMVAKYAFEHFARIPVEVDIASEYRYRSPVTEENDLFIVISQSGETADTLAAMRLAKKGGNRILAITNVVGSTLAREADLVLFTMAGPEIAVASTKAFTTQLMCLYLLALKLGKLHSRIGDAEYRACIEDLGRIPSQAEKILARQDLIQRFASRQFNKQKVFFMGRQFDYAISLESALKLKEISYTHSEAFAAGELKHGPIALVDKDTLVVTIATQTVLFDKLISNIRETSARGASSLVISWEGETSFESVADEIFAIPKTRDCFSPLLSIIPAQLFAYYCSIQRGNNPDKPRNLAKSVTVE